MPITAPSSSTPPPDFFPEQLEKRLMKAALEYARRGWYVFPCNPRNKAPNIGRDKDQAGNDIPNSGGLYKATRGENQIRAWWQLWPNAMIGVRMGTASGVWALDPDAPKKSGEPDGRENWKALQAGYGACPPTHTHNTPGGGQHLLFLWEDDRPVTNGEGALKGLGINVRGEGGYIIVPPSISTDDRTCGRSYEIAESLDYFHFAKAPEWLYDKIFTTPISKQAEARVNRPSHKSNRNSTHRPYANAALNDEYAIVAATTRPGRNTQLNISSLKLGQLVAAGELSENEVKGAMYDAALANGHVADKGKRATLDTINSGFRKGMQEPRVIPPGRSKPRKRQGGPKVKLVSNADWLEQCAENGSGKALPTLANAMLALRLDPSLRDAFAYDEMLQAAVLMR